MESHWCTLLSFFTYPPRHIAAPEFRIPSEIIGLKHSLLLWGAGNGFLCVSADWMVLSSYMAWEVLCYTFFLPSVFYGFPQVWVGEGFPSAVQSISRQPPCKLLEPCNQINSSSVDEHHISSILTGSFCSHWLGLVQGRGVQETSCRQYACWSMQDHAHNSMQTNGQFLMRLGMYLLCYNIMSSTVSWLDSLWWLGEDLYGISLWSATCHSLLLTVDLIQSPLKTTSSFYGLFTRPVHHALYL